MFHILTHQILVSYILESLGLVSRLEVWIFGFSRRPFMNRLLQTVDGSNWFLPVLSWFHFWFLRLRSDHLVHSKAATLHAKSMVPSQHVGLKLA